MEATAHIELGIGDHLKKHEDSIVKRLHQGDSPKPRYLTRTSSKLITSLSNFPNLDLGSPPIGYMWTLRASTCWVNDPVVAVYASHPFFLYVTSMNVELSSSLNLSDLMVASMNAGQSYFFSEHSIHCYPSQNLIVQFGGIGQTGLLIGANVTVVERPLDPIIRGNSAH